MAAAESLQQKGSKPSCPNPERNGGENDSIQEEP